MTKKEHRKPSYPAALRMARIAFELPSHPFGWPLDAIQRELGISERTLKRYLAAGKEGLVDRLGRPYFQVITDGGKPKLRLPASRKPVESTAYQAVSLSFTLAILKFLEGTVLEAGIENLWETFAKSLPAYERADLGALDRKFYAIAYAPKDYRSLGHILSPLVEALLREYRLQIDYATGVVHQIEPYTLLAYRGGLYVIGKTPANRRIITLAVERMRKVELLIDADGSLQKFAYPAGFRPERHTEGAFGIMVEEATTEVEILIHNGETEAYLQARRIHPTQRFTRRRDGKALLTMAVRGTVELRNWILGFGPWLEVLKPPALRAQVAGLLRQASRNYKT
ncbi:MAG: WYL domain-containing protein [Candidatus Binataceae bacterium]|nr:WYL domain-containing protein [Candidatus Binataceae bacterium]